MVAINGPLARNEAWDVAANCCAKGSISVTWQSRFNRSDALKRTGTASARAARSRTPLADFCKRQGKNFDIDELEALIRSWKRALPLFPIACLTPARAYGTASGAGTAAVSHSEFDQRAPVWLAAQNSLNQLSEQWAKSSPLARMSPNICNSCWSGARSHC